MAPYLIDSHCHLDFPDFSEELDDIIERARAVGVSTMITISTRIRQFDKVIAIAEKYAGVYCTVGTHPHYADEEDGIPAKEFIAFASHPKVVGIGECGLDFHYDNSTRGTQERGFRIQIEAARRTGLPVVIHSRNADKETEQILREEADKGPFKAVLHCFSASACLAAAGVELGHYVSFSGIVTFNRAEELRVIAASIPDDRILVETDAPYLAPVPKRGGRNEPAYVTHTAQRLAEIRGVSIDVFYDTIAKNTCTLFNRLPKLP
jgi:TatD DNase family protein